MKNNFWRRVLIDAIAVELPVVNVRHHKSTQARDRRDSSEVALVRRGAPIYVSWVQAKFPELNEFTRKFSERDKRALSFVMNNVLDAKRLAENGKNLVVEYKKQQDIT